jgi:hypothetical protein
MSVALQAAALEMEFSAGTWTDVWDDVTSADPIRWVRGIRGNRPTDRVAGVGTLTFSLKNGEDNSAGLVGYYSPGHANCRAGFEAGIKVRLRAQYGDTWYTLFTGRLKSAVPTPGVRGPRRTRCRAEDWIASAARHKLDLLSIQTNRRSDLLVQDVLNNMGRQPEATSLDEGLETFAYAPDNARDEKTTALAVLQGIAMSEYGYIFVRGDGTLVFENRHTRVKRTAVSATITNPRDIEPVYDEDRIYNLVRAIVYPREVGTTYEVLASLNSTPSIAPGETLTVTLRYTDPNNRDVRLSAVEVQDPVAGTDYEFSSSEGGGGDLNDDLQVVVTKGGNAAEFALTNNGSGTGYVTKLQIRGKAIRIYDPVVQTAEDATSQDQHDKRPLSLVLPYQDSPVVGRDFAQVTLQWYKDPTLWLDQVRVIGDNSDAEMLAALGVEIGDRITVQESVSGVDGDYFVNAVAGEILPGQRIAVTWTVVPATFGHYLILDTDKLDSDQAVLGF